MPTTSDHTRKGQQLYRYYVSQSVLKGGANTCPVGRLPAAEIEAAVIDQLRALLRAPEVVFGTWRSAKAQIEGLSEDQARQALQDLDPLWDELFPDEQARSACVERACEPILKVVIHIQSCRARRLSMMRIVARRTKAATVLA